MTTADALAEQVFAAVKGYCESQFERMFEQALARMAPVEGPAGKDGKDGADASVDTEALVSEVLARIPTPKDGADGKSVEPADLAPMLAAEVEKAAAAIPRGPNPEQMAEIVSAAAEKAAAAIPPPKDGKDGKDGESIPVETVAALVHEHVEKAVCAIPKPKDGKDGKDGDLGPKGDDGQSIVGLKGDDGRDGRDGKDGKAGRDAAHIEVLDALDEAKSYQRGTFARHRGGLWFAKDTTDGMDGWTCVMRGIDRETEEAEDCGRTIKRVTVYSDGERVERVIKTRVALYGGVFVEGEQYEPGDLRTWAGSMWHCNEPTGDKPGEGSKAWTLAVKHGRNGRDAK